MLFVSTERSVCVQILLKENLINESLLDAVAGFADACRLECSCISFLDVCPLEDTALSNKYCFPLLNSSKTSAVKVFYFV